MSESSIMQIVIFCPHLLNIRWNVDWRFFFMQSCALDVYNFNNFLNKSRIIHYTWIAPYSFMQKDSNALHLKPIKILNFYIWFRCSATQTTITSYQISKLKKFSLHENTETTYLQILIATNKNPRYVLFMRWVIFVIWSSSVHNNQDNISWKIDNSCILFT